MERSVDLIEYEASEDKGLCSIAKRIKYALHLRENEHMKALNVQIVVPKSDEDSLSPP